MAPTPYLVKERQKNKRPAQHIGFRIIIIKSIATILLDAGLQRRIAAVAIADGHHEEGQKFGVSTNRR